MYRPPSTNPGRHFPNPANSSTIAGAPNFEWTSSESLRGEESSTMRVWPGKPYPLGATWDGEGVNFALFSEHATRVELC
ncbi:MAG: hypothetical protein KF861_23990, partial [Planctomycetaceae bacterium]|nr:hypothetical protein [Planctomycetaceae bacterium]